MLKSDCEDWPETKIETNAKLKNNKNLIICFKKKLMSFSGLVQIILTTFLIFLLIAQWYAPCLHWYLQFPVQFYQLILSLLLPDLK